MRRAALLLALVAVCAFMAAACSSLAPGESILRGASLLVLSEGAENELRLEGDALSSYLRNFSADSRTGYKSVEDTRSGFIVIDGLRYLVTSAKETGTSTELITIHSGSSPIYLKK